MKIFLFSIGLLLISFNIFSQVKVTNNYTAPNFVGSVKVQDTLGIVNRLIFDTTGVLNATKQAFLDSVLFLNIIGIGDVSDRPLTIKGNGANPNWISLNNGTGTLWGIDGKSGGFKIEEEGTNDKNLFIEDGGNVGIGTTTLEGTLTIDDNANDPKLVITPRSSGSFNATIELHGNQNLAQEGGIIKYLNSDKEFVFNNEDAAGGAGGNVAYHFQVDGTDKVVIHKKNTNAGSTSSNATLKITGGITTRGGSPGAFGENNNGYSFEGGGGDNDAGMFSSADGQIEFYTNNIERMKIDGNGNVVGTFGNYHVSSDSTIKKNIETIDSALYKVTNLRGVTFNWKDTSLGTSLSCGLISQEVESYVPEIVFTNDSGLKAIEYWQLSGLFVEAIKELNQPIKWLDIQRKSATNDQTGIDQGIDIILDSANGNIPYNSTTGIASLEAGTPYVLWFTSAAFSISSSETVAIQWVKASDNTPLYEGHETRLRPQSSTSNGNNQPTIKMIYKPTVDIDVKLRCTEHTGTPDTFTLYWDRSFATINELR